MVDVPYKDKIMATEPEIFLNDELPNQNGSAINIRSSTNDTNVQLFVETQDLTTSNQSVNNHIWHSFFDIVHNKWSKFVQLINKKDLDDFQNNIMNQIAQLSFDASWPVGSTYVQYPGCKEPSEIFSSVKTSDGKTISILSNWVNISSPYNANGTVNSNQILDGASFFRTEGSPANAFLGSGSATLGQSQPCGAPNIKGWFTAAGFTEEFQSFPAYWDETSALYGTKDYVCSINTLGDYDHGHNWVLRFDASRSCSAVYKDDLNEVRPKNYSIKIWRRKS